MVYDQLEAVGSPYLYIAGNHDWHYEGMEGTTDALRETWRKKQLEPLYGTNALSHFAVVKNGINFIAIDNSTYQVDEQQLTPLAFPEITSRSAVEYVAGAGVSGGYRLVSRHTFWPWKMSVEPM